MLEDYNHSINTTKLKIRIIYDITSVNLRFSPLKKKRQKEKFLNRIDSDLYELSLK